MSLEGFQVVQELSQERGNKVYLARSKGEKVVGIKVLASQKITEDQKTQLSKESTNGARLNHEAILQTRSMILKDDFVAVVTEFIPGVSLQRLLRFATGRNVRLPDTCAYYILERVLAALASAHGATGEPILHRGLSPASVTMGWDGSVKLGDFGLVRMRQIVGVTERDPNVMMAPEETRGEKPDARGDVYCAALLAIRLLTGRTPYARFRGSATELMLAMAEGDVTRLAKTRSDLPAPLRDAIDEALEADREKRTITAQKLLEVVRANTDTSHGKALTAKLLNRWREALEAAVTPWERRASIPDDVPEEAEGLMKPGTLALWVADERPSDSSLLAKGDSSDEPWKKDGDKVPAEDKALQPTDPHTSLSRVGSIAPEALIMPLPAMRITMPELPTYGGPPVNVSVRPPVKQPTVFTGPIMAAITATVFIVLIGGAIILFRWLLGGH
ncbi:MAG: serine/threonine-protein kinase [Labilithrix sp.]